MKVILNHWVFNIKSNSCYRSWLVAKEFSQVKRIDFNELFSLVVYYEIAYLFLTIVTLEDWDIHSVDIKTAYLYGDLDKEIYIEQPKYQSWKIMDSIYFIFFLYFYFIFLCLDLRLEASITSQTVIYQSHIMVTIT